MNKTFAQLLLALTISAAAAAAIAQTPEPTQTAVPGAAAAPIHLHVVVNPAKGSEAVPDLAESAFTVLDNGVPRPLESFRAVTAKTEPVRMLLVIDAVNINYSSLAYERGELQKFLHSHDGQLPVPTSIAVLTDTNLEALPNYTTDGNALAQVMDSKQIGLRNLRRSSGFWGAEERLQISLRAFRGLLAQEAQAPGRKMIVWISPGWPLLSGPRVELSRKESEGIFQDVVSLSTQMRQADVTLYSVDPLGAAESPMRTLYYENFLKPVRKPGDAYPGSLALQVLALQSGGLALSSSNDVVSLLQRCADDARASYEMSFRPVPGDAPEQFHKIDVRMAEPHLVARTEQGYYTQP